MRSWPDATPATGPGGHDALTATPRTANAEEIDARYLGQRETVASPDTRRGVEAVEGDEVTLSTLDPMKPAVLRGVGHDDYLYLLMPVRVP